MGSDTKDCTKDTFCVVFCQLIFYRPESPPHSIPEIEGRFPMALKYGFSYKGGFPGESKRTGFLIGPYL